MSEILCNSYVRVWWYLIGWNELYLWARFQVLRDLIPQNDQKRDKASFLLEVVHSIICFLWACWGLCYGIVNLIKGFDFFFISYFLCAGYWVYSVSSGKITNLWTDLWRVESGANKINSMGKVIWNYVVMHAFSWVSVHFFPWFLKCCANAWQCKSEFVVMMFVFKAPFLNLPWYFMQTGYWIHI